MSGDPEQEYFADGTTEDIITDLSKISGLFVIARNSSFAYKGQTPDLRVVGRELGVRHILEGSVRRAGEQVRINAQLVDTQTGGHIWAERYDGSFNNIFALQDEITGKIVSALKISLTTGERARAEIIPTEDMEAYDLFLRGRAAILPPSRDGNARARELLEQAVERDPKFAEAHALLGYSYFHSSAFMWADEPGKDKALETAKKGVELDESSALAHARYGWLCCVCGDYDLAVAELERAIELDPNDADSYHWLGETLNYMGEPEKALEIIKTGMRLSPHLHGAHLGNSKYLLRQFDDAITALNEGKIRAPGFPTNYIYLAVVYAELGREVEARAEIANVLEIVPSLTIQCMREKWPWFKNKIDADRFVAGLRKAGLPEE